MNINSVADELYSLPVGEFTVARNACAKEAKETGDKQLASAIRNLRKPSNGAWLANQLVREHSDEVQSLLHLGAAMREATAMLSGDQLRELGKQRRQLVNSLMQQVRRLASAAGHHVSQDTARGLEDTLHAALADERLAEQLSAGRLTDTLQGAGFPGTPSTTLDKPAHDSTGHDSTGHDSTAPDSVKNPSASANDQSSERSQALQASRAEREEELSRAAVRDAADDLDQARAALDRTDTALHKVTVLVRELRANLDKAEIEQSRREQELDKSQSDLDRATRAAREAALRLDDAIERREGLST